MLLILTNKSLNFPLMDFITYERLGSFLYIVID